MGWHVDPHLPSDTWHVLPVDDLIEHEDVGTECVCNPRLEAVPREDGTVGALVVHHSLDGRENREE